MTPCWHPPHPRLGSKRRDAAMFARVVAKMQPAAIGVPFLGLFGEGQGMTYVPTWFYGADSDPGVRAVWRAAAETGVLVRVGDEARRLLRHIGVAETREIRIRRWRALRECEHASHMSSHPHAHLSIALGAGAHAGGSRRNKDGLWTQPCIALDPAVCDPGAVLAARVASPERLAAANLWASHALREGAVYCDWRTTFDLMPTDVPRLYSVDPPYGNSKPDHYSGAWSAADLAELRRQTVCALVAGLQRVGAVIWCGVDEWKTWRAVLIDADVDYEVEQRKASTAMKPAKRDADGNVTRPARLSDGGYVIRAGAAVLGERKV